MFGERDSRPRSHHLSQDGKAVSFATNLSNATPKNQNPSRDQVQSGDLIFDAQFECGNLGKIEKKTEFEYELQIRADSGNAKQRIWFHFKVWNSSKNQHVIFNIVNYCKCKATFRDGLAPVVRSSSRPQWERLPSSSTFYYKCPTRLRGYTLSFAFVFDEPDDVYEFAYCYPYSYSQLQEYLSQICQQHKNVIHRERFASSLQKRRLDILSISSPENLASIFKKGPAAPYRGALLSPIHTVVVTARVHPGETPSSYVAEGLITFLASDDPVAQRLRSNILFKIVPMLNPDGVVFGNYRGSSTGQDLNRCYQNPKQWNQPEIHAVKKLLVALTKDPKFDMGFYLDLHAHTATTNSFLYGNWYNRESRMNAQWKFPNILRAYAADFSNDKTDFNSDKAKAGTGRRSLAQVLDSTAQIYTLEVSFYGYRPQERADTIIPYTISRYKRLGVAVARSFLEYFKCS